MPLGESDRLLTILTQEFGLIRAVAPGARKHHSKLSGRSGLFVINQLLISKGRSLDKITQAETVESYPGLSQDLGKLTASQYLAELVLCQALSDQSQADLFCLLSEHLSRLECLPGKSTDPTAALTVLAHLAHATFHLLALAGVAPQVQVCCVTQSPLTPNFTDPNWRVGFSMAAGGTVDLAALERLESQGHLLRMQSSRDRKLPIGAATKSSALPSKRFHVAEQTTPETNHLGYQTVNHPQHFPALNTQLTATELALLQLLPQPQLPQLDVLSDKFAHNALEPLGNRTAWLKVERILRQYAQYQFHRPIRSAALIDTCFQSLSTAP